jgi:uncharacterized protein YyaL (SSP411 family)
MWHRMSIAQQFTVPPGLSAGSQTYWTVHPTLHKLFEAQEQRIHPGPDEKVLTSWNGLMLAAFAEAARTLNREGYRQVAERNLASFTNELHYVDIAHQSLAQMQTMMAQYPLGSGQWLQALAYALLKP